MDELPRIIEVFVAAFHPGFAPEEVAACLGSQEAPVSLFQIVLNLAVARFMRRSVLEPM